MNRGKGMVSPAGATNTVHMLYHHVTGCTISIRSHQLSQNGRYGCTKEDGNLCYEITGTNRHASHHTHR